MADLVAYKAHRLDTYELFCMYKKIGKLIM